MKKIYAIVASLAIASISAFGQQVDSKAVVTNGFAHNWFISASAGANYGLDKLPGKPEHSGLGLGVDLTFGKWFAPTVALRAGITGLDAYKSDKFTVLHFDVLWNMTNQFCGYKENRCYNFIPYFSAGLLTANGRDFTDGFGLLNKFRLSNSFDVNLDIRGYVARGRKMGPNYGGGALLSQALLGITYNFGKSTTWKSTSAVASAAAAAAAKEVMAKNAKEKEASDKALAEKDAAYRKALAERDAALKKAAEKCCDKNDDAVIAKMLKNVPAEVYFEIGKAKLCKKQLQHFDFYAKNLVGGSQNLKFIITSSADKATGSAKRNKFLMEKRGEYVANLLTDKYGVDASKITVITDKDGLYTGRGEMGRVSVITVAE